MNYTEKAFINLISACINNDDNLQIDFERISADYLTKMCLIHNNVAVIYSSLQKCDNVPKELLDNYKKGFMTQVMARSKNRAIFEVVTNKLFDNNISFVVIKGVSISKLYPSDELRSMGDIDLLIRPEDKNNVINLLKKMGATINESQSDSSVTVFYIKNITIEIHTAIGHGKEMNGKVDYEAYFSDVFSNVTKNEQGIFELNYEYNFVYVLYHMAQHFYYTGCGVRMVTDVAVMLNKYAEKIDWDWFWAELKKLNLFDFANVIFGLCNRWFGTEVKLKKSNSQKSMEIIEQYILSAGVFGFENVDGDMGQLRKNNSDTGGRFSLSAFRWAFPSYEYMKEHSRWFENKTPLLLPLAYIERFVRNAKKRGGLIKWYKKFLYGKRAVKEHDNIVKMVGLK